MSKINKLFGENEIVDLVFFFFQYVLTPHFDHC